MGATACIIVTAFIDYYERSRNWHPLAWWIHDRLPYGGMEFYPRYAASNLTWREGVPRRQIYSRVPPQTGWLTRQGMANHGGDHSTEYEPWLQTLETPRV